MFFEKENREEIWERYREVFGESEKLKGFARKTMETIKAEEAAEEPEIEVVGEEPVKEEAVERPAEASAEKAREIETELAKETTEVEPAAEIEETEEPKIGEAKAGKIEELATAEVTETEIEAERAGYAAKIREYFNNKNKGLRRKVTAGFLATLAAAGVLFSAWGGVKRDDNRAEVSFDISPAAEAVVVPEFVPSAERIGQNIEFNVGVATGEFAVPAATSTPETALTLEASSAEETPVLASETEATAEVKGINDDAYYKDGLYMDEEKKAWNEHAFADSEQVKVALGEEATPADWALYVAEQPEALANYIGHTSDAILTGELEQFRGMTQGEIEQILQRMDNEDPAAYDRVFAAFSTMIRAMQARDGVANGRYDNAFMDIAPGRDVVHENMQLHQQYTNEYGTPVTIFEMLDENGAVIGNLTIKTGAEGVKGCMQAIRYVGEIETPMTPEPDGPQEETPPEEPIPIPIVTPEEPEPEPTPEPEPPAPTPEPTPEPTPTPEPPAPTPTPEPEPAPTPEPEPTPEMVEQKDPESEIEQATTGEDAAGFITEQAAEGEAAPEQTVDMTQGGTEEVPQAGTSEQQAERAATDQAAQEMAEQIASQTEAERQEAEDSYIEDILNGGTI